MTFLPAGLWTSVRRSNRPAIYHLPFPRHILLAKKARIAARIDGRDLTDHGQVDTSPADAPLNRRAGHAGMDQMGFNRQSRASRGSQHALTVPDLGNEPPLSVDGGAIGDLARRRVSIRWLSATVLTGLCGATLMGGAVWASLDGESVFAIQAERIEAVVSGAGGGDNRSGLRKSDRLVKGPEAPAAKHTIRAPTTTRMGDREIMRMRPYTRVAANLSLNPSDFASKVPPFNPLKLFADANPGAANEETINSVEPDAELTLVMRDLSNIPSRAKPSQLQNLDEVIAKVRDAANSGGRQVTTALLAPMRQTLKGQDDPDPYAGIDVQVVPENVTLLAKITLDAAAQGDNSERTVALKRTETLSASLRELGATPDEARAIVQAFAKHVRDGDWPEGTRLHVLFTRLASGRLAPARVTLLGDTGAEASVAQSDAGRFVQVAVTRQDVVDKTDDGKDEEEDNGSGVRIYNALYETALRHGIPKAIIEDMIRVYSYDIDFQKKVTPGDSFEILYSGDDEAADQGRSDVLYTALTVGGETRRFYRFQTSDDGLVDYYDDNGKSAKKFLMRKPMNGGIMRSGFGGRRHPILGYYKMHTGVDWAAPRGTPIMASGNGTIEKAGWESGYGKYIRIQHSNGYETAYGHMSAFARNSSAGARVRQGQVIGYVGSTGLSTGAHLHYEVLVNGHHVNPMRIKLPRGRSLDGRMLADFERERTRIDDLNIKSGGTRVAAATGNKREAD